MDLLYFSKTKYKINLGRLSSVDYMKTMMIQSCLQYAWYWCVMPGHIYYNITTFGVPKKCLVQVTSPPFFYYFAPTHFSPDPAKIHMLNDADRSCHPHFLLQSSARCTNIFVKTCFLMIFQNITHLPFIEKQG